MSNLDTILTVWTAVMYFAFAVGAVSLVRKGTPASEAAMDFFSTMTYTQGNSHGATLGTFLGVVIGMALFNYFWPVPVYTAILTVCWVIGWVVQIIIRLNTGESFGSCSYFGVKLLASVMK